MASPTQCTWVWASSRRWERTGKPGVLQSIGSQRVRRDWTTHRGAWQSPTQPARKNHGSFYRLGWRRSSGKQKLAGELRAQTGKEDSHLLQPAWPRAAIYIYLYIFFFFFFFPTSNAFVRASLMVQWLKTVLPMLGTQIWSLVKDLVCSSCNEDQCSQIN